MPLRDHFHPPLRQRRHWEGFHSAWANTILRHLMPRLPPGYYAEPQIHLGVQLESDVATFHDEATPALEGREGNGIATAVSAPPQPARTFAVDFPAQDLFEIRVHDEERESRLVAAIELVSPGNKDQPETRRAFAIKCASYLQQRVSLIVIDIVTERQADLCEQLLELLLPAEVDPCLGSMQLHAAAYRAAQEKSTWRLDVCPERLAVADPLPVLPLWLADNLSLLVDLEATYEETCQVLRIH